MRVRVVENSAQRLSLTLSTNLWLYAGFGLLFIGLGLWCTRLLAVEVHIVVEQQQLRYTQTCLWVFDCGSVQAGARDVRGVAFVGSDLSVELPDGAHALALPQSGGDEKVAIAHAVEQALAQPDASFEHKEGSTLAGLLLGLTCIGGGMVILAAIQRASLSGDRSRGTFEITRRLWLWPIEQRVVIELRDLEAVRVVPSTLRTGRHIVTSWSVRLQRRAGDRSIPLTFLPMFTESAANDLAAMIRTWSAAT